MKTWWLSLGALAVALATTTSCGTKKSTPKKSNRPEDQQAKYLRSCRHDHQIRRQANEKMFNRKLKKRAFEDSYYDGCVRSKLSDAQMYETGEFDKFVDCQLAAKSMKEWVNCADVRRTLKRRPRESLRALRRKGPPRLRQRPAKPMSKRWIQALLKGTVPQGYGDDGSGESGVDAITYSRAYKTAYGKDGRYLQLRVGISSCAPHCGVLSVKELREMGKHRLGSIYFGKPGSEYEAWEETVGPVKAVGEWIHGFVLNPEVKHMPLSYAHRLILSWSSPKAQLSVTLQARGNIKVVGKKLVREFPKAGKDLHDFAPRKQMLETAKREFQLYYGKLPAGWK